MFTHPLVERTCTLLPGGWFTERTFVDGVEVDVRHYSIRHRSTK